MGLFDNRLRYEDGMSAGLLNNGFELDSSLVSGHWKKRSHTRQSRYRMMRTCNNMELKIYPIRQEGQRLAT